MAQTKAEKRAYARAWYAKNREKVLAKHRAKRKEKLIYLKEWRAANPDYQKRWFEAHPDYHKEWRMKQPIASRRAAHYRHRYGLGLDDVSALFDAQGGKCVGCGSPLKLGGRSTHVDHDHETGQVRGLLCRGCNTALGNVKDSPDILQNLAAYIYNVTPLLELDAR